VEITPAGEELAKRIYKRHTVLKQILITVGVSDENAEKDACSIEHIISEESFQKLMKYFKR
jgi:Mn-dependent DtxR family transcriptional regulator